MIFEMLHIKGSKQKALPKKTWKCLDESYCYLLKFVSNNNK